MTVKLTVENAVQAKQEIEKLETQGYVRDNIHIFAHFKERADDINDALDTSEVGMKEQGFLNSMKNLFTSRGDELRNKMEANDALDTSDVGMKEQGFLNSMKNLFTSRGDELRNKMEAAGISKQEAETAEKELDEGKLIIIAHN